MFFSKYSASGNDFLLTHAFKYQARCYRDIAKVICHRQKGIGADGLIVLRPHDIYDIEWEFYNSDGSDANMCGNGTRATAMYARDFGLAGDRQRILTKAGVINVELQEDVVESELTQAVILQKDIIEQNVKWWLIDTGVPHLVCENANLSKEDLRSLRHKYNANVNIAKIEEDRVIARTFERGVEDETLACGTGMAAMFYYLLKQGKVSNPILFNPKSGEDLCLKEEKGKIFLKGRVQKICDFIYQI